MTRLTLRFAALAVLAVGCGGGTATYPVSGTVTFDGKPVKAGYVSFEPDASKGNPGPGSGATIADGKYATPPGKGVLGGAYKVKITGTDGVPYTESGETVTQGKSLFPPYVTTAEFPKSESTKDFDVPKKAADVPKAPPMSDGL